MWISLGAMHSAQGYSLSTPFPSPSSSRVSLLRGSSSADDKTTDEPALRGLNVAVVGAGPSGLLLSHKLANAGATVNVFEGRSYPDRSKEPRAYALGIGRRGRTAIQSAGRDVWEHIKSKYGYPSERFQLHVGPLRLTLRDGQPDGLEPSLLLYQTDLCRGLVDTLQTKYTQNVRIHYQTKIDLVNLQETTIVTSAGDKYTYDVIIGCDGVNSIVRKAMETTWSNFECLRKELPGVFKVAKVDAMPPKLDPTAVALLLPQTGACTAFVEPVYNQEACILFAGRDQNDAVMESSNATLIYEEIEKRFPRLQGLDLAAVAQQLATNTKPSKAYSIQCNTYNYAGTAALVGDAAHATGGVSGQGVNSALVDATVLCDILEQQFDARQKNSSLRESLLEYSKQQVPEGKALYELSFGPNPTSKLKKAKATLTAIRDTLFQGRYGIGEATLQTQMTTTLTSFATLRRQKDKLYDEPFPSQTDFGKQLADLDSSIQL